MKDNDFMKPVNRDGQLAVMKAIIEQEGFYKSIKKIATPEVFGNELSLRHLMRMIIDGEKKFNKVPGYMDLNLMITQEWEDGRCSDIEKEILDEVIEELKSDKYLVDMSIAKEIITNNFKTLHMIKIGNTALKIAQSGPVDYEAQRKIKNELDKFESYDDDDLGTNPWDAIDDVLDEAEEEHVTTGMRQMDSITNGGLEKGCVGVVISRSGGGKTTMSSYMANKAALSGKVVVQIVFEDKENAIHRKHYATMTGMKINQFTPGNTTKDAKDRIWRAGGAALRQNLIVKRMINQRTTVDDIFNFVASVETARGQVVDEIFIDYFDCLQKEGGNYSKNYEADAKTIKLIEAMAAETNKAVWVFQQTNRNALKAESADDGAANQQGGIALWQTASIYLILKRTHEEIEESRATLVVDKNRFGEVGQFENIYFDNATCQISLEDQDAVTTKYKKEENLF